MIRYQRFLLWFIIAITAFSVFINIPKVAINFDSPVIPFFNKKISIHKTFSGEKISFNVGSTFIKKDFSFQKGLDLAGGTSITLQADMKDIPQDQRNDALDSARTVIERRINLFGVREPVIQTAKVNNDYRIIVELPGVTDVEQAKNLIGKTAQLTFWEEGSTGSAVLKTSEKTPEGLEFLLGSNPKKTNLSGNDLQRAQVTFDQNTGNPQVQLTFTDSGTKKFAEITKRNVGKVVAIVLDDQIIQAPRVNEPILQGNAVITGGFTTDQAKAVVIQLNAGALPVPLKSLEEKTVGATLGESSLHKSFFAGFLGFLTIVIFMSILYGRLGIIASFALVVYTLFTLALFRIIPVTLTLAGIAGFILSIGMAVDANILIFERMREEFHKGKPTQIALELGFSRAWSSIRDSNVSSLITSAILYYFGNGMIRGFAFTLALGVLVSMFSAIVVTRTFLRLMYRRKNT